MGPPPTFLRNECYSIIYTEFVFCSFGFDNNISVLSDVKAGYNICEYERYGNTSESATKQI